MKPTYEQLEADLRFAKSEAEKWKRKWEASQQIIAQLNKLHEENTALIWQQFAELKQLRGDQEG